MGNLGGEGAVVHEEKLDVLEVADKESLVAGGGQELGLLVGTIADLGHGNGTAESSSDSGIDTLGLAPARVHALEPITLVTGEALRALLHDGDVLLGGNHLDCGLVDGLVGCDSIRREVLARRNFGNVKFGR